jgi:hypothetical protein
MEFSSSHPPTVHIFEEARACMHGHDSIGTTSLSAFVYLCSVCEILYSYLIKGRMTLVFIHLCS